MQTVRGVRDVFDDPKICKYSEKKNSNPSLNLCYCKLDIMKVALKRILDRPCPSQESGNEWQSNPDFKYILQALNDIKVGKKGATEKFNFALAKFLFGFAVYRCQVPNDVVERKLEFEMNKMNAIQSYYS